MHYENMIILVSPILSDDINNIYSNRHKLKMDSMSLNMTSMKDEYFKFASFRFKKPFYYDLKCNYFMDSKQHKLYIIIYGIFSIIIKFNLAQWTINEYKKTIKDNESYII